MNAKNHKIYLDYAAATPVREEVVARTVEVVSLFANPSSIHKEGVAVRNLIKEARGEVANTLGAHSDEIIFTSGSTEGLNISIQGIFKKAKQQFKAPHIVTGLIEHPSILETVKFLESEGARITYLTPNENGVISVENLEASLESETVLVALTLVNSEIGSLLPVRDIAKSIKAFRRRNDSHNYPYFLLDATQAVSVFDLNVKKLGVDLMTIDGAKIGGLKGSGALFVRRGVEIEPILFGGGQERGLRPGTTSVLNVESLRLALRLAVGELGETKNKLEELSGFFITELKNVLPNLIINSGTASRAPQIVSVCFPDQDAEWIVLALDARGISVSRGSACKSGKGNESEVLRIIRPSCAESSIRFSFGRETTKEELKRTVQALIEIVGNSPNESNG